MRFNKFVFKSLFLSASLALVSSASAGFDQRGNLRISAKKLQEGYEKGHLTLKNGKTFAITKALNSDMPDFNEPTIPPKIYGTKCENYFYFEHSTQAGPLYVEEKKRYDYSKMGAPSWAFRLILTEVQDSVLYQTQSEKASSSFLLNKNNNQGLSLLLDNNNKAPLYLKDPLSDHMNKLSISDKKASSLKIFQEPDISSDKAKNFYGHHDSERKLWIYMERLTETNRPWWRKKMGYDAFALLAKYIDVQRSLAYSHIAQYNPNSMRDLQDSENFLRHLTKDR